MINSLVLFFGAGSFLAAFLTHILVWRIIRPRKQIIWLGVIFIILPVLLYLSLFFLSYFFSDYKGRFFSSGFNLILTVFWHIVLSLAYIMSYPAAQAESPTFKIILSVADSMPKGMTAQAVNDIFSEDVLLNERIEDLVRDGLIFLKDGKCVLSYKGRLIAAFFSGYRRLLSLPQGEG